MSNRDDFDDLFDDDDLFNDDDDLFADDEPARGQAEDFDFEDDDLDSLDAGGLDDDFFGDDFSDLDEGFLEEEQEQQSGPSRTFVILAGILIILFIAALGLVIFLALQDGDGGGLDPTRTAIAQANETQLAFLQSTQTQAVENQIGTQTQAAEDLQATSTALVVAETASAEAVIQQTEQAIARATQTAEAQAQATQNFLATQTAQVPTPTPEEPDQPDESPEPPPTSEPADVGDVAATATALFEFLLTPVETVGPGQGGGDDGQQPGAPTSVPGQLPETGLFDEVSSGQSMGLILLAAFGLVGVIFGARRLRAINNRE